MNNLEKQLIKETLHETDSKSALSILKTQCVNFFHSELLKLTNYDGQLRREIFKEYTRMEAHSFKELKIESIDFIKKCIVKRVLHAQEIQNRLNERKLMLQGCNVQEVKAADASTGNINVTPPYWVAAE
ncbi:hypothetical protein Tco_1153211 [Tanacetum coccineum]